MFVVSKFSTLSILSGNSPTPLNSYPLEVFCLSNNESVPVAVRSKASVCGRSFAGVAGSNPAWAWMSVCCECCVLSGRGLCDELIFHPEESCRVLCVCDRESSTLTRPWPSEGLLYLGKRKKDIIKREINFRPLRRDTVSVI